MANWQPTELPSGVKHDDGRLVNERNQLVYLVDGGCFSNGRSNSVGVCAYFAGDECSSSWRDRSHRPTNNTAELGAIEGAIRRAEDEYDDEVVIMSDSKYAINALTVYPDRWQRNSRNGAWRNATGKVVANQELIKRIIDLKNRLNVDVHFQWIPRGKNKIADRLARAAI